MVLNCLGKLPYLFLLFRAQSCSSFTTRPKGTSLSSSLSSSPLFRSTARTSSSTSLNMNMSNEPKISISSAFDGGNGKYLKTEYDVNNNLTKVYVIIKKDPFTQLEQCHHFQYFSFRSTCTGISGSTSKVKYILANAGKASYPSAWDGSTAFYSTSPSDPHSWKRKVETEYDESTGELSWEHEHVHNGSGGLSSSSVYFSYFPPYSYQRHLDLISQCSSSPLATVQSLGQSIDGRELELISVGSGSSICWIIHRQHPGESMSEYYAEGLLNRLLGLNTGQSVDGTVRDACKAYTFYIVPNMCPDGSYRGHLRTNASGQNLNREWCSSGSTQEGTFYEAPTVERSPEVYYVLKKMDETGVDVFLDVHGDEELPFNFLAGGEGVPKSWNNRMEKLHGAFLSHYARTNSDMQIPIAYDPEESGMGRMNVCSNQVMSRYDCLAATLEMPFKDCMSNPDPERGWNPARAMMLGASVLEPLLYVGPFLREKGEFWNDAFSEKDRYVRPTANYKS